ncbi:MAG: hypothetical protein HY856_13390 [Burkholderiales bacterium]|nr:hypothetical protein [Burkholderiales bacterium]
MSDVIEAAAMRCRTMADGTLRIEVEIEPVHATQAFTLFGRPGAPVALAALRAGYAAAGNDPAPSYEAPQSKLALGSGLARLAAMWCNNEKFQAWTRRSFPFLWSQVTGELGEELPASEVAAEVVRRHCGVESRAELDTNEVAGRQFNEAFRLPFREVLERG